MPLQFTGIAAEVLFWIFVALFFAAVAGWLAAGIKTARVSEFLKPLPMLFWGAALCCLAPKSPVIYLAAFLFSAGDLFEALHGKNGCWKLVSAALYFIAAILQLILICVLFADCAKIPRKMLLLLIPVFLAAGGGAAGGGFLQKKRDKTAAFYAVLATLYGAALIFQLGFAIALFVANVLYATLFVLLGAIFAVAALGYALYAAKKCTGKLRGILGLPPFLIAQILLSLGTVLSFAAVLIQ